MFLWSFCTGMNCVGCVVVHSGLRWGLAPVMGGVAGAERLGEVLHISLWNSHYLTITLYRVVPPYIPLVGCAVCLCLYPLLGLTLYKGSISLIVCVYSLSVHVCMGMGMGMGICLLLPSYLVIYTYVGNTHSS